METAATAPATEATAAAPVRISGVDLTLVGATAGLGAGAVMAATLMGIAEIAADPTFAPGIDSSAWTPFTGIAAFVFGSDAFHGDFEVLPLAFGLAAHFAVAVAFGVLGLAFLVYTLGARPGLLAAAVLGAAYGLFLEVSIVNAAINNIQSQLTVYESLPQWGWWVAHTAYGAALGIAGGLLLGARPGASPGARPSGP